MLLPRSRRVQRSVFISPAWTTAQATGPFETCLGARRAAKDVLLDGGGGDEKWRSAKTDEQRRMEAEGRRGWEVVKELLHDHSNSGDVSPRRRWLVNGFLHCKQLGAG